MKAANSGLLHHPRERPFEQTLKHLSDVQRSIRRIAGGSPVLACFTRPWNNIKLGHESRREFLQQQRPPMLEHGISRELWKVPLHAMPIKVFSLIMRVDAENPAILCNPVFTMKVSVMQERHVERQHDTALPRRV